VIAAPVIESIEKEEERLKKGIDLMRRFGYIIVTLMLILILASVFMNVGLGFKYGNPTMYVLVHTKEAIWTFMLFNFIYMYFKYRSARKAYEKKEWIEVQENLILMIHYLIPLNFVLGLIAAYFGIILRGY
jgi:lipopolysaccharide/colanic/teichoic acid biosynthesis glycosyltransferase